jgi:hypothetical protein
MASRLTLRDLWITNGNLPEARITFGPGLNLVIGATDTGKTFIFEAIDFMLGAKDGLRRIPESEGYTRVNLSIDPSAGVPFTLQRAFDGGNFTLSEFADGRDKGETSSKNLRSAHSAEPDSSLSAYLLQLVGIGNRQVRSNVQGEKKSLSFRHVAYLTLIDEERIIQQASPVLSQHDTANTAEANVFAYFLTGHDDSAIIPQEASKSRNARLATEAALLENILEERRSELAKFTPDPSGLLDQAQKLELAIAEATKAVIISQAQINELNSRRGKLFDDRAKSRSRILFLQEQLKQLRLLDAYYRTDLARLEAVIEASQVIHDLPEGSCPLCSQTLPQDSGGVPAHAGFEAACRAEAQKIGTLQRDLLIAIADAEAELGTVAGQVEEIERESQQVSATIKETLAPATGVAQSELSTLVKTRTTVAQGMTLLQTVKQLEERLDAIRAAQKERIPKPVFEPRATTSSASEFCKVVEEILSEWNYPALGTVAFDTDKCDLVIGGKDRANTGKGYRAITYAAFVIGLMKYCRKKSIPHPGFVVLDTPVNPYKGPTVAAGEKLTDDVKTAFFEYLAKDQSGDQYIIMENSDPPNSLTSSVNYYNFTRNAAVGRYGFFPPRSSTSVAMSES